MPTYSIVLNKDNSFLGVTKRAGWLIRKDKAHLVRKNPAVVKLHCLRPEATMIDERFRLVESPYDMVVAKTNGKLHLILKSGPITVRF